MTDHLEDSRFPTNSLFMEIFSACEHELIRYKDSPHVPRAHTALSFLYIVADHIIKDYDPAYYGEIKSSMDSHLSDFDNNGQIDNDDAESFYDFLSLPLHKLGLLGSYNASEDSLDWERKFDE